MKKKTPIKKPKICEWCGKPIVFYPYVEDAGKSYHQGCYVEAEKGNGHLKD